MALEFVTIDFSYRFKVLIFLVAVVGFSGLQANSQSFINQGLNGIRPVCNHDL
jgi:hypothetical protein